MLIRPFLIFLSLTYVGGSLFAQTDFAEIAGRVTDPQQSAIPGALVEARDAETQLTRSTHTDGSGEFVISAMPPGSWSVSVSQSRFHTQTADSVRLFSGETRRVDFQLRLAAASEQVQVNARISEVDRDSATLGGRIQRDEFLNLPLNGRNFASLLSQIPGAVDPGVSDQRSVRFLGHGRDDNSFEVDGVDAGGISNQPQKSAVRLSVPTSTIGEMRVDTALFKAETGTSAGAQVALVSASGTNSFHGELFEYLRNDVFDARNPFSPVLQPFRLNQFGATLGGPIQHDRTFAFGSYEGYRQRLAQPLQGYVPNAEFRANAVNTSPEITNLVNAFPAGMQPSDAATDFFNGLSPQKADENSGMMRIDHYFTNNLTGFFRVNADESLTDVPLNNLRDRTVTDTRPISGVLAATQVFSPRILNDTRLGFNQVFSRTTNQTATPYTIRVPGFTTLSSSRTREEDDTSASLIDTLSIQWARHLFKAGGQVRRIHMNPASSQDGTVTFASQNAFTENLVDSASVTGVMPLKRLRKTQFYGFVQDEFRATANLTLTMGLRYEYFGVFSETEGRAIPFDFYTCGGFCSQGSEFSAPRTNDFDPRLSVAWAPAFLHGRTAIRAGYGVYHGDGQLEDQNLPASNDVPRYSLSSRQIPELAWPIDPYLLNSPGVLSPRAQNRNRKDEYSSQWGLSIQQQLPWSFLGTVSYQGIKGTHLQTITAANVIDPLTGQRPFPQYGQVEYRTSDSNSSFNGLILSGTRRFSHGLVLNTNYMWSHAIDDGSLGGGEADIVMPQNVFCRACERASSAQDIRHYFTFNAVYDLPFGYRVSNSFARALVSGWSLSTMVWARTGRPVNVTITRPASAVPGGYNSMQRPDLIQGVSLTPDNQTPASYFNAAAFAIPAPGTWGDLGRNVLRGPSLQQVDLGLARRIRLTERLALDFRAEAFNLFNRAQYADPSGDVTVPSQFGKITSTINTGPVGTGTPRQLQLMLRANF